MSETLNEVKSDVLEAAEGLAVKLIEKHFDASFEKVATKLKEAIPGQVDDMVIDMLKGKFQPELKADLLALASEIHKEA